MFIDDQIIHEAHQDLFFKCYIPEETIVVAGSSNQFEHEVHVDYCHSQNIPLLKRYGGGGTVVLYPGCMVISLGLWTKDLYNNAKYFRLINEAIITQLKDILPELTEKNLKQDGISDLCIGPYKFGGTSLFRSRNYLLYQGSLLIDLDMELIDRCLRHPSREPDYRKGRRHQEFLRGLGSFIAPIPIAQICTSFARSFESTLRTILKEELTHSDPNQLPHLLKRIHSRN